MKKNPCIKCDASKNGKPCDSKCEARIEHETERAWAEHDGRRGRIFGGLGWIAGLLR